MNIREAIQQRHSVRAYDDRPITGEDLEKLEALIRECNEESGLHIQLVTDEPKAFQSRMARYGHFSGVRNYIVMAGKRRLEKLDELCGYYGVFAPAGLELHTKRFRKLLRSWTMRSL